jgi:hypothetical protein
MDLNAPAADAALQEGREEAHRIVRDAQNAGVPAFEFPPDASHEEKAAMAKKVRAGASPALLLCRETLKRTSGAN